VERKKTLFLEYFHNIYLSECPAKRETRKDPPLNENQIAICKPFFDEWKSEIKYPEIRNCNNGTM